MTVIVYYCERCGRRIEIDEIEQGQVAQATNGYYCCECARELGLPLLSESVPTRSSGAKKESKITTYKIREHVVDEYELSGMDDKVVTAPTGVRKQKTSSLPIILGIVGVLVIIVVIVAAAGSGGGGKNPVARSNRGKSPGGHKPNPPTPPPDPPPPPKPTTPEWQVRLGEILKFWDENKSNLDAYPEICRRFRNLLDTPRLSPDATDKIQDYYDSVWVQWRRLSSKYYKDLRAKEAEKDDLEEKLSVWDTDIPSSIHSEIKEAIKQRKGVIKSALEHLKHLQELKNSAEELLSKDSDDPFELGGIVIDLEMLAGDIEDWIEEARDEEEDELKGRADLLSPYVKEAQLLKKNVTARVEALRKKKEELEKRVDRNPPDQRQPNPPQPQQNMPPWSNWNAFKQRYSRFWKQRVSPNGPELTVGQAAQRIPVGTIGAVNNQNNTFTAGANSGGWLFLAFGNGYEFRDYTMTLRIKIVNTGGGLLFIMRGLVFTHSGDNRLIGFGAGIDLLRFAQNGQELTIQLDLNGENATLSINNRRGNITLPNPNQPMTANPRPNPPTGVPMLFLRNGASVQILGVSFELKSTK